MKVKLMHTMLEPSLLLFVVPETEEERDLLRFLWKHGSMETCNGVADRSSIGFAISTSSRGKTEELEVK